MKKSAKEVKAKTKMLWKTGNSGEQAQALRYAATYGFTNGQHPETLQQSYGYPMGTYIREKHGRLR